jgi:hypothetical protein
VADPKALGLVLLWVLVSVPCLLLAGEVIIRTITRTSARS